MKRRAFFALAGSAVVTWPLAARAQQPAKIHRIGILETVSSSSNVKNIDALRRGLRTWPDVRLESAFGGTAEVEFRGRQVR